MGWGEESRILLAAAMLAVGLTINWIGMKVAGRIMWNKRRKVNSFHLRECCGNSEYQDGNDGYNDGNLLPHLPEPAI
jgi:hypothetical protein